jgi:hypothetical protein
MTVAVAMRLPAAVAPVASLSVIEAVDWHETEVLDKAEGLMATMQNSDLETVL